MPILLVFHMPVIQLPFVAPPRFLKNAKWLLVTPKSPIQLLWCPFDVDSHYYVPMVNCAVQKPYGTLGNRILGAEHPWSIKDQLTLYVSFFQVHVSLWQLLLDSPWSDPGSNVENSDDALNKSTMIVIAVILQQHQDCKYRWGARPSPHLLQQLNFACTELQFLVDVRTALWFM